MSDRDDFVGEDFEWDEPALGIDDASAEPASVRPPRSFAADLDRLRASPARLALVALAAVALVALVVVIVVWAAGGDETNTTPATTTSPATTAAQTQTQPAPAPAPAPQPAITVPTATTLRPGDDGATVRTLQRALRRLGLAVGNVDGIYGPKTEAAVTEFQRTHDLTADGVVGPKTAQALNEALAQAA